MRREKIYKNLMELYPGEELKELKRKYYKGKIRTTGLVLLVGVVFSTLGAEDAASLLWLAIVTSVSVFFLLDTDLEKKNQERKKEMRKEYPGIVNRLSMYMEAGMTIRGAFLRVGSTYTTGRKAQNPISVEFAIACNALQSGVSEAVVYENFGRRTGMQEYTRVCRILNQSLKKGSVEICSQLRQEGERALEEGLRFQKKCGEEAETKLLLPMIMIMAMVMLLVMIPAFSGMNI